jgi:ComF family protein
MQAPAYDALRHRIGRRLDGWLDRLVPRRCALCDAALAPRAFPGVCVGCLLELPGARRGRCARCGLPSEPDAPAGAAEGCPACDPFDDRRSAACPTRVGPGDSAIDRTVVAADYAAPLDRWIAALKFGRELALARPLGELVAAGWLGAAAPVHLDCLVPVPLGPARLSSRGFNQSLEMARAMSRALARPLPVHALALRRPRDTPAQSGLDRDARQRNLVGGFVCVRRFDGRHVGVVDDVMTTGSTLAEAARALKAAGAARVVALVAARTA